MKVKLIAIAALGKKRQIGLKSKLPWCLPDEYQHFKQTIKGQYILIGRKNLELHGHDVDGAKTLVLTHNTNYKNESAEVFHKLSEVISFAKNKCIPQIYVIGGAEIYKLTLPYLSDFLWSEVDYDGEADTFFPEFSYFEWTTVTDETHTGWRMRHLVKTPEFL